MDKHIIHIDYQVSFSDLVSKDFVHHLLECGRGVTHSEKHDCGFKESSAGLESGFPLVTVSNPDVVISGSEIDLGKVFGSFQFVQQF